MKCGTCNMLQTVSFFAHNLIGFNSTFSLVQARAGKRLRFEHFKISLWSRLNSSELEVLSWKLRVQFSFIGRIIIKTQSIDFDDRSLPCLIETSVENKNLLAHLKVSNGLLPLSPFFARSLPPSFPSSDRQLKLIPKWMGFFHQKTKPFQRDEWKVIFSLLFCGGHENENANLTRSSSRKKGLFSKNYLAKFFKPRMLLNDVAFKLFAVAWGIFWSLSSLSWEVTCAIC